MSLSIGIVGLPNVGKSTLFNALLKRQAALAANYPFATIEPNVGIVDVPDKNLEKLVNLIKSEQSRGPIDPNDSSLKNIPEKVTPAVVTFNDIAGLVKGASKGEGLGNKFLSHIREVDAIVHVVRAFSDTNVVREGSVSPKEDVDIINTELILADLDTITVRIDRHQASLKKDKSKENIRRNELYLELKSALERGEMANSLNFSEEDKILIQDTHLLTLKPTLYVFNVDETEVDNFNTQNVLDGSYKGVALSAKIESELSVLDDEDQKLYMEELGISQSGLDKVISTGYEMLGLQTFYTAGPKEVRAWTIEQGTKAPQAAGKIHTDFEKGFVKAMVISIDDLINCGSYKVAKEKGLLRMEGKEYVMRVGDVVEFRINS